MLFRKIRYAVARLHEARAGAAQKAGRAEDAARLMKRAEEIFRHLDSEERIAERDTARAEVPRA